MNCKLELLKPLEPLEQLTLRLGLTLRVYTTLYAEGTNYRGKDGDENLNNLLDC